MLVGEQPAAHGSRVCRVEAPSVHRHCSYPPPHLVKRKPRQANSAGHLSRGISLLFASGLAHNVLSFADAAANVTLSLLGFALAFEMAIAERLPGFLLNRAGAFLDAGDRHLEGKGKAEKA